MTHGFVKTMAFAATLTALSMGMAQAQDPLPSWNDGAAKRGILKFVAKVTKKGAPEFVPVSERIAVFDNDGTLWPEQPMYTQSIFVLDRLKVLAPQHPEWKHKEPFASLLKGDVKGVVADGEKALLDILAATHSDMTNGEFRQIVQDWLATATHPRFKRPYTDLSYQPMIELLAYLRANGFKTFIVSAGGMEFIRAFAEKTYSIPPEQVIGSEIKTHLEFRNGKPVLVRLPVVNFINDKASKPGAIQGHIGRRPIAAFGNSDGDLPMLQWTCTETGARFCLYVHHTDAVREWAYDRESPIGQLDQGLDEAKAKEWTVVDIKNDWKKVFAFE